MTAKDEQDLFIHESGMNEQKSCERMSDTEKLRNALVWHDFAARSMIDAVAALLEATDFDANPTERHKARSVAKRDLQVACRALEQAQLVQTITEVGE